MINRKRYNGGEKTSPVTYILEKLFERVVRIESKLHNLAQGLNTDIGEKEEDTCKKEVERSYE